MAEEFKRYGIAPGLLVFEMEIKPGEAPPREVEASADGLTLFDRERMQVWVRQASSSKLQQAA